MSNIFIQSMVKYTHTHGLEHIHVMTVLISQDALQFFMNVSIKHESNMLK